MRHSLASNFEKHLGGRQPSGADLGTQSTKAAGISGIEMINKAREILLGNLPRRAMLLKKSALLEAIPTVNTLLGHQSDSASIFRGSALVARIQLTFFLSDADCHFSSFCLIRTYNKAVDRPVHRPVRQSAGPDPDSVTPRVRYGFL